MVLLSKKISFLVKCAHFTFLKVNAFKSKQIHRKVKCAHLVPEPGIRWRGHVVPGSKKKNLHRKSDIEMHRQMHRTDVVPELAGKQCISLVARSKNLNYPVQ